MRILPLLLVLSLCACSHPEAPAASPPASSTEPPARAQLPFVGKVWAATTRGSPLGAIKIFLPDGTLLMDSCFETYRLSEWGTVPGGIRWIEDTIPIQAEVTQPSPEELVLHMAGRTRQEFYVTASVPYVCPDMPK